MDKLFLTILLLTAMSISHCHPVIGNTIEEWLPVRESKSPFDSKPEGDWNLELYRKTSRKGLFPALNKREYYGLDIADYGNSEEARRAAKQRAAMNLIPMQEK